MGWLFRGEADVEIYMSLGGCFVDVCLDVLM